MLGVSPTSCAGKTTFATALAAQREGVARLSKTPEEVGHEARERIGNAREASRLLQQEGLIPLV